VLVFQNLLVGYCLAVVIVGTTGPAVASGLDLAERTTGGEYYARLLAPAGAVTAVLCLLVTLPACCRIVRLGSLSAASTIAHGGVLVMALGVAYGRSRLRSHGDWS
jgi:cytochrome c biogenesis factor